MGMGNIEGGIQWPKKNNVSNLIVILLQIIFLPHGMKWRSFSLRIAQDASSLSRCSDSGGTYIRMIPAGLRFRYQHNNGLAVLVRVMIEGW